MLPNPPTETNIAIARAKMDEVRTAFHLYLSEFRSITVAEFHKLQPVFNVNEDGEPDVQESYEDAFYELEFLVVMDNSFLPELHSVAWTEQNPDNGDEYAVWVYDDKGNERHLFTLSGDATFAYL